MKAILSILTGLLLLGYTRAQAQETTFGGSLGVNFATVTTDALDVKSIPGLRLSAMIDHSFDEKFGLLLLPGFSTKGFQLSILGDVAKMAVTYVEVPLYATYSHEIGGGKIVGGVGPYLAYGLSGTVRYGGESEKLEFGNTSRDDIRPFDAGLNLMLGVELVQGFRLMVSYSPGLSNISTTTETIRNSVVGLSVGYLIKR